MKIVTRGLFGSLNTNLRWEMKIQYDDQKTIVLPPYLASECSIRLFTTPECAAWTWRQCVQIWHANVTHTTPTAVRTWEGLRAQRRVSAVRNGSLSYLWLKAPCQGEKTREISENHREHQTHYAARATIPTHVLLLALCA